MRVGNEQHMGDKEHTSMKDEEENGFGLECVTRISDVVNRSCSPQNH